MKKQIRCVINMYKFKIMHKYEFSGNTWNLLKKYPYTKTPMLPSHIYWHLDNV